MTTVAGIGFTVARPIGIPQRPQDDGLPGLSEPTRTTGSAGPPITRGERTEAVGRPIQSGPLALAARLNEISANTAGEGVASLVALSPEEEAQVAALKARDREVRAHEGAHRAAGGAYASAPSYQYEVGPDGQRYAVGGEVSISTSPVDGDPAATIQKLQQVKRAALAPARPSAQDRAVAAQADAQIRQAEQELAAQRREEAAALTGGGSQQDNAGLTGDSLLGQLANLIA